jgi:uncharacterized protein YdhG (YjbR/CyaY superfamily)
MGTETNTVINYLKNVQVERSMHFNKLRDVIVKHIPKGFEECISYGMIGYVVPHSIYSSGYHCNPKLPLPFISIASQKNFIALHHLGIYANPELLNWFVEEYPKHSNTKLDMGKGCIRFKKAEDIPFKLIEELVKKTTVKDWISKYEELYKKVKK